MAFKEPECYVCGSNDFVGAFNINGMNGWMWFCAKHKDEVVAKGEAILAARGQNPHRPRFVPSPDNSGYLRDTIPAPKHPETPRNP